MVKQRRPQLNTVEQVVCANTGMTKAELLDDRRTYAIKGLDTAVGMIKKAIREHKTIYVPGDYDVDGILASGILALSLHAAGAKSAVRLPRRFSEGYGLGPEMIGEFDAGQLVVTVDNGISSIEAVRKAKDKGLAVIITDHHLPLVDGVTNKPHYPDADLIIDPNAIPNSADFNGYCGAGLAYKLAAHLLGPRHPLVPKLKSLAAIATIADSVPLIGENRRIVKEGLRLMRAKEGATMGLYALLSLLGLDPFVTAENIAYKVAPALNAPGRLRDDGSMDAFKLVVFDGPFQEAKKMAEKLVADNMERRRLSDEWLEKSQKAIESEGLHGDMPIVAYIPGIPEGIIGIIAGRIAEKYCSPCFLFGDTRNPDIIKDSGRSFGDVHLKGLLDQNQRLLTKYGGHALAAGLSMKKKDLCGLRMALKGSLQGHGRGQDEHDCYDIRISPDEIGQLMEDIIKFEPYGAGNPSPLIMIENLTLMPAGKDYFKGISADRGIKLLSPEIEAVSFNGAEEYRALNDPRHVTLVGTVSRNYFMGKFKNQIEYRKIFAHGALPEKSSLALALEKRALGRYVG